MPTDFISMAPAPALVRAALAHCEIPLDYTDEGGVRIPAGPGFDSNGNMTISVTSWTISTPPAAPITSWKFSRMRSSL
jgi:hypothetical protein